MAYPNINTGFLSNPQYNNNNNIRNKYYSQSNGPSNFRFAGTETLSNNVLNNSNTLNLGAANTLKMKTNYNSPNMFNAGGSNNNPDAQYDPNGMDPPVSEPGYGSNQHVSLYYVIVIFNILIYVNLGY